MRCSRGANASGRAGARETWRGPTCSRLNISQLHLGVAGRVARGLEPHASGLLQGHHHSGGEAKGRPQTRGADAGWARGSDPWAAATSGSQYDRRRCGFEVPCVRAEVRAGGRWGGTDKADPRGRSEPRPVRASVCNIEGALALGEAGRVRVVRVGVTLEEA